MTAPTHLDEALAKIHLRPGFCKHYQKRFDAPGTCAVGLNPHSLKDDARFLPSQYMPCIPEQPTWCAKREVGLSP